MAKKTAPAKVAKKAPAKADKKAGKKADKSAKPVKAEAKKVIVAKKAEAKATPMKKETKVVATEKTVSPAVKGLKAKSEPVVEMPTIEVVEKKEVKPAKEPKTPKVKVTAKEKAAIAALNEEVKKWFELKNKFGHEKAINYSMTEQFEANKPIQHKILGWGYILSNQNDRLEVLFEQGVKILISNRQS